MEKDKKLRKWLAEKYAPVCAVFASNELTQFLRDNASLSPAEFLRPFGEVGSLGDKSQQTFEKNSEYRYKNLRLNMIDVHKMEGRYYKETEYSGLFQIILDIERPKDPEFSTLLQELDGDKKPVQQAQRDLNDYLARHTRDGTLTPWFHRWKKWFLDKTRFKDHELLDQPLAFFFFVMADEPDPLGSIAKMRKDLPSQYRNQIYLDGCPQNIQEYVLVLNHHPSGSTALQEAVQTLSQKFPQNMIFDIPMSDRSKINDPAPVDDLWIDKYIDLDARNLIDLQVAMADPNEKRIRGKCFSPQDRQKVKAHMRKIVESRLMPFARQRIRSLEETVAKTRKGIKNQFSSFFKKPDRGESDGLKENFRMNKSEHELRNLCDLAFIAQDYETAQQNADIPLKDFKQCKAFRFAASCLEVQLLSTLTWGITSSGSIDYAKLETNTREAYTLYHKSSKSDLLIKYAVMISDMYEVIDKLEQSAQYLIRIANEIQGAPVIVALFFEQAALHYLKLKQYRKFAFFMAQSAMNYSSVGQNEYALNCYRLIHPFYQAQCGWHHVRFLVYSNLGSKLQGFKDKSVADDFFRNYLKLCSEVDDQNQQKKYIVSCRESIQGWLKRQGQNSMLDVGDLNIPMILEDQLDIFVDSERLYSNFSEKMTANQFLMLPQQDDSEESVFISMKTDLNSNTCQWKHMAKSVTDYIKTQGEMPEKLQELSVDEITEYAIYDCSSRVARREQQGKKQRRVYCGTPITLKIVMKNTLSVGLDIKNIKIACEGDCSQEPQNLTLEPLQIQEILIQVVPQKPGDFVVKKIEWELFEVVKCSREIKGLSFVNSKGQRLDGEMALKFKAIEASGECQSDLIFQGQEIDKDQRLIYSECKDCVLKITNLSNQFQIKNAYVTCSHPLIFNFENQKVTDMLNQGESFELPLHMKANLIGDITVKFLVRYEVSAGVETELNAPSRFRFLRHCIQLRSEQSFLPLYRINLSSRIPGTHLVNLSILAQKMKTGHCETPEISAIEIINSQKQWKLCRKEESGKFFAIQQADQDAISILKFGDVSSVIETPYLASLLEKEIEYLQTKGMKAGTDTNTQVDFLLHWNMPNSMRKGYLSTFKQELFTRQDNQASAPIEPVHVVFNYNKQTLADQLPVVVPLNLSITPQVAGIQSLVVKVSGLADDSFSWVGKITHKFNDLDLNPKRVTLQALIHEVGVYDLNQIKIEIQQDGKLNKIQLNDEMVIEVKMNDDQSLIQLN